MKRTAFLRICAALALFAAAAGCSRDEGGECLPCRGSGEVAVQLADPLPVERLETRLWLFRRPSGTQDGYLLDRSYASFADGEALKIPLAELERFDYRLFAVAQPADGAWLTVGTDGGVPLAAGDAWEAVRLVSDTGAASLDGYCGYADKRGEELLAEGSIRLTLTRVAGQVLFDFFRTAGSLDQPEGILSADVASVIDRVSLIEIAYREPTASLRFAADGKLVADRYAARPLRRTIRPEAPDLRVALPQADKGLTVYDEALRGSLRIVGDCLLPSDASLRIEMTFTYYDTTPVCGNDHTGAHDATCFAQRQLTLRLPAADAPAGLPVASDCYTINRAGLRCDRIIDVPLNGGIVSDFSWTRQANNASL